MRPYGAAVVALVGGLCAAGGVPAQGWKPVRHVEFVAASGAGSASDGVIRAVERLLQDRKMLDVTSAVVNKPGGGGTIGWTWLNQQPADGHHLTLIIGNLMSNHITGTSALSHNDFTCAAQLLSEVTAVAVRSDSSLKSGKELVAQLKTNPGALSVAVGTAFGGSGHIGLALATKSAGGDPKRLKAVVFPAVAQGLAALYGGHIDLVANPHSSFAAALKEGRVRVLALAAPQRLTGEFAAVPTWRELGVESTVEAFRAVAGPKGMAAPQVAYWEATLRKMAETAEWKQLLETRTWVDRFAGAEGCKTALKYQYDQMRAGLLELGLAKH